MKKKKDEEEEEEAAVAAQERRYETPIKTSRVVVVRKKKSGNHEDSCPACAATGGKLRYPPGPLPDLPPPSRYTSPSYRHRIHTPPPVPHSSFHNSATASMSLPLLPPPPISESPSHQHRSPSPASSLDFHPNHNQLSPSHSPSASSRLPSPFTSSHLPSLSTSSILHPPPSASSLFPPPVSTSYPYNFSLSLDDPPSTSRVRCRVDYLHRDFALDVDLHDQPNVEGADDGSKDIVQGSVDGRKDVVRTSGDGRKNIVRTSGDGRKNVLRTSNGQNNALQTSGGSNGCSNVLRTSGGGSDNKDSSSSASMGQRQICLDGPKKFSLRCYHPKEPDKNYKFHVEVFKTSSKGYGLRIIQSAPKLVKSSSAAASPTASAIGVDNKPAPPPAYGIDLREVNGSHNNNGSSGAYVRPRDLADMDEVRISSGKLSSKEDECHCVTRCGAAHCKAH